MAIFIIHSLDPSSHADIWTKLLHQVSKNTSIYFFLLLIYTFIDNIYISDLYNHRIRKITASTSIITTIAGTGTGSYSGDGGQATSAAIRFPCGINLDSSGNVYFGDQYAYNGIVIT